MTFQEQEPATILSRGSEQLVEDKGSGSESEWDEVGQNRIHKHVMAWKRPGPRSNRERPQVMREEMKVITCSLRMKREIQRLVASGHGRPKSPSPQVPKYSTPSSEVPTQVAHTHHPFVGLSSRLMLGMHQVLSPDTRTNNQVKLHPRVNDDHMRGPNGMPASQGNPQLSLRPLRSPKNIERYLKDVATFLKVTLGDVETQTSDPHRTNNPSDRASGKLNYRRPSVTVHIGKGTESLLHTARTSAVDTRLYM
ncbi:hypothetical protein QBC36DRAFT_367617 [Triangularia setosa]|uniref:Uncharacterized protein n=1 Tax=Triangularia setosa TaxID=2587417 RepID=A0AAN6WAT1_9PEZI|nr:hypothetical protein QBC36DRAFT_367617 [Podospora setosa]